PRSLCHTFPRFTASLRFNLRRARLRPRVPTLFPYTTLFRSRQVKQGLHQRESPGGAAARAAVGQRTGATAVVEIGAGVDTDVGHQLGTGLRDSFLVGLAGVAAGRKDRVALERQLEDLEEVTPMGGR